MLLMLVGSALLHVPASLPLVQILRGALACPTSPCSGIWSFKLPDLHFESIDLQRNVPPILCSSRLPSQPPRTRPTCFMSVASHPLSWCSADGATLIFNVSRQVFPSQMLPCRTSLDLSYIQPGVPEQSRPHCLSSRNRKGPSRFETLGTSAAVSSAPRRTMHGDALTPSAFKRVTLSGR